MSFETLPQWRPDSENIRIMLHQAKSMNSETLPQ